MPHSSEAYGANIDKSSGGERRQQILEAGTRGERGVWRALGPRLEDQTWTACFLLLPLLCPLPHTSEVLLSFQLSQRAQTDPAEMSVC